MNLSTFTFKRKRHPLNRQKPMGKSDHFSIDNFYYREITELTGAGGWSVDFKEKMSFFDVEARKILNVPEEYQPTLKEGYQFYAEEHMQMATELFFKCAQGESFTTEIKMVTYDKHVFWAKAAGKPLLDKDGEIVGIRGVFQSIQVMKDREIALEESVHIIENHNERLYDFAHIISHNLRSQVSNLLLTETLFDDSTLNGEQKELLNNFGEIGRNLDTTLKHLNKIVYAHNAAKKEKELINIQSVYNRVIGGMEQTRYKNKVVMYTDFSEVEEVMYIEAYLESIIQNLITNAIKYKHPERDPEISIFTFEEQNKKYLAIKDNGIGIDLEKHGRNLFKLYQTFHDHPDAVGLGLFLTKNEVEAMGGTIEVESRVGKGSKFTVQIA